MSNPRSTLGFSSAADYLARRRALDDDLATPPALRETAHAFGALLLLADILPSNPLFSRISLSAHAIPDAFVSQSWLAIPGGGELDAQGLAEALSTVETLRSERRGPDNLNEGARALRVAQSPIPLDSASLGLAHRRLSESLSQGWSALALGAPVLCEARLCRRTLEVARGQSAMDLARSWSLLDVAALMEAFEISPSARPAPMLRAARSL